MKKQSILLPLLLIISFFTFSQEPGECVFEQLFTVKPGMGLPEAISRLQEYSQITFVRDETKMLKPYSGTTGDSIQQQIATYRVDSSECLKGRNSTVKFSFADGKLYKAFLGTVYSASEFQSMMSNFNLLHKRILQTYPTEKMTTIKSENVQGLTYNFYKKASKNSKTAKIDMCMLQYLKQKGKTPGNDTYELQIYWVNLNDTRMEDSMF